MASYKAHINIMPLEALLDPQGKAVTGSMTNIGLAEISHVRIGKHITLTLDANNFYSADWAHSKGLYNGVYEDTNELESAVQAMAQNIANYNPSALKELKKVLWKDTENWDELLKERAAISGKLVLSAFTKEALKKFQN